MGLRVEHSVSPDDKRHPSGTVILCIRMSTTLSLSGVINTYRDSIRIAYLFYHAAGSSPSSDSLVF